MPVTWLPSGPWQVTQPAPYARSPSSRSAAVSCWANSGPPVEPTSAAAHRTADRTTEDVRIALLRFAAAPCAAASSRSTVRRSTASAASTAPALSGWRRQRECDKLSAVARVVRRRGRASPHANHDELPVVVEVRHRQTALDSRQWCLPDLRASRLVVRVEERRTARAFTREQKCLRH